MALLCVLLAHALILYFMRFGPDRERAVREFETAPITMTLEPLPAEAPAASAAASPAMKAAQPQPPVTAATPAPPGESAAITPPERVDWPIEGKKSAAKVLAAEAEAERVARLFSGAKGTLAALTARERAKLKKFRWKPGIDGLKFDDKGNSILQISDGCVLVNLMVIGCTIGKAKVHGDLFEDMRLYFDEQRRPPLPDGTPDP